MNILLIGVLVLGIVSIVMGYMKGIIRIGVSLLATIVTIMVVGMFSGVVADLLMEYTPLEDAIESKFTYMFFGEDIYMEDYETLTDDLTLTQQITLIQNAEIPEFLQDAVIENNNSEIYSQLEVTTFSDYIGTYLSQCTVQVLAYILTFLMVWIVLRVVVFSLEVIANLPVLRGINRFVGAIFGLEVTVVVVWLFFLGLSIVYTTEFGQQCYVWIDESALLTWLYEVNPLYNMVL